MKLVLVRTITLSCMVGFGSNLVLMIIMTKQWVMNKNFSRAPDSLSQRSWVRYLVWPHTFISPSTDSRGRVSYWQKYVQEVLVNRLGGQSLPRKSVVRLTDCPDMTVDVYRGRKTTTQHEQEPCH